MSDRPGEPTGIQYHLRRGPVAAQISQVGASLRHLAVGGVDIVPPYPLGMPAPSCAGVVLVPWPNRVRDGVWTHDGEPQHLAITEPARNNAIHGLLRFSPYDVAMRTETTLELTATVFPQLGYRFQLDTSVRFALTDTGVEVTHEVVNVGRDPAPVALGVHPFVTIGGVDPDDLVLAVSATEHFPVDDRMLPGDPVPVAGTPHDLRAGRRLAELELDDAWGGVVRGDDGRARHTVTAPDGRRAVLWAGPGFDYVQAFTTGSFPGQRRALAIEPMTAPADAFNSGRGLRWLEAGESWALDWGIALEARHDATFPLSSG